MVGKYKTKFPMARIKKIMQADEQIGKVAQGTPIVISKSLEIFLQKIIDEACKIEKGTTRILPSTIKHVITNADEYDFLKSLVEGIESETEVSSRSESPSPLKSTPNKRKKHLEESDDEIYESELKDQQPSKPSQKSKATRSAANSAKMNISSLISKDNEDALQL